MAVADVEKADKMEKAPTSGEGAGGGSHLPAWLSTPLGWGPQKFTELKAFLGDVRSELKKVTWPARAEVYSTTVVVVATTVFFGFYLWSLDLAFSRVLSQVLKR
jgi:preprotein translocase subunit SecE